MEDALYDSQALRGFVGVDLAVAPVPDATTLLKFRHWLERHDLTRVLFEEIGAVLEERGLLSKHPAKAAGAWGIGLISLLPPVVFSWRGEFWRRCAGWRCGRGRI